VSNFAKSVDARLNETELKIDGKFKTLESDIEKQFTIHEAHIKSVTDQANGGFAVLGARIQGLEGRVTRLETVNDRHVRRTADDVGV
jgi:predicted Zn-dependent protease